MITKGRNRVEKQSLMETSTFMPEKSYMSTQSRKSSAKSCRSKSSARKKKGATSMSNHFNSYLRNISRPFGVVLDPLKQQESLEGVIKPSTGSEETKYDLSMDQLRQFSKTGGLVQ